MPVEETLSVQKEVASTERLNKKYVFWAMRLYLHAVSISSQIKTLFIRKIVYK